ncbi:MAG: aminotransferase class IV [Verrucomicrobia bacterium]|jgi:aminodeoxychorismate lyase|nr:aminotransferase class IV [Verrucomicrobiota bacterium]
MVVFLNGKFASEAKAVVRVNDRGFLYGDGLFETMRVFNGRPFRMAQHLERMVRGANFLKIPMPFTPKELHHFAGQLIEKNKMPEAVLRVTLTRGPGERGYSPKNAGPPTVVMTMHEITPVDPANPPRWHLVTSSFQIPASDPLASFKTTNKLLQIAASAEAEARDADDALLVNTNGEVAETASANLFWIYHDKICTTPTGRGALPGITRAVILEICQVLGLQTNKRVIKREALKNAEAIFLSQSALGLVSIVNLDGDPVPESPLVEKIYASYCEMLAKE